MTHTHTYIYIYMYTRVEMHAYIYYIDMDAAHITRMCQNGQPKKSMSIFRVSRSCWKITAYDTLW